MCGVSPQKHIFEPLNRAGCVGSASWLDEGIWVDGTRLREFPLTVPSFHTFDLSKESSGATASKLQNPFPPSIAVHHSDQCQACLTDRARLSCVRKPQVGKQIFVSFLGFQSVVSHCHNLWWTKLGNWDVYCFSGEATRVSLNLATCRRGRFLPCLP
jgi:hypothetical protein